MDLNNIVTDILKSAAAGVIVVFAAYRLVKPDVVKYLHLKSEDRKGDDQPRLLLLRLQAHERMLLFIERINPANLLVRVHQHGLSVKDMQSLLLDEIRAEYQHNVTQQLYLETSVWKALTGLKDDTLAMINNVAKSLPEEAEGVDLSKRILQHISQMSEDPYQLTLELIKKDIQRLD